MRTKISGAGLLIVSLSTKNILLGLRNDEIPTWATIGGGVNPNERYVDGAIREVMEETGFILHVDYWLDSKKPIHIFKNKDFSYRTYLSFTKDEVLPRIKTSENLDFKWLSMENLPESTHFGVIEILNNKFAMEKIRNLSYL